MNGVIANFERAMIRERVRSGLERVKAQGRSPIGRYGTKQPKCRP